MQLLFYDDALNETTFLELDIATRKHLNFNGKIAKLLRNIHPMCYIEIAFIERDYYLEIISFLHVENEWKTKFQSKT